MGDAAQFRRRLRSQVAAAPDNELDVDSGEPFFHHPFPQPVDGAFRRRHPAETDDQVAGGENRKDRLAVDGIVAFEPEIFVDDPLHHRFEPGAGNLAVPDRVVLVGVHVPQGVGIMVGPHQKEFGIGALQRRNQPLVELAFEAGSVFIPVPVHDEGVDAVFRGEFDMLFRHGGVGLVLAAQQREARHIVAGETRRAATDGIPLSVLLRPEPFGAGFVMVRGPDIGGDVVFFHGRISWLLLSLYFWPQKNKIRFAPNNN